MSEDEVLLEFVMYAGCERETASEFLYWTRVYGGLHTMFFELDPRRKMLRAMSKEVGYE